MKFPNAAKGVKRIYTAQILSLIAAFASLAGIIILLLFVLLGDSAGGFLVAGTGTLVFSVAAGVLVVIAFIMNMVGIVNASKDEKSFQSALICLILGIILSLGYSLFVNTNPTVAGVLNSASTLFNTFVTIFVIVGIIKLGDKCNRGDISTKGSTLLKLIIAINLLTIVIDLIVSFMGGAAVSVVAAGFSLFALMLNIVQYCLYLSYLSKAKKMLAQA